MNSAAPQQLMKLNLRRWSTFTPPYHAPRAASYGLVLHRRLHLGLTLARRIAEEHGGSVCLEESDGERTVFTLSLTKNRSLPLVDPKSGQSRLQSLQQWICELLIKNQQLRWALREMSGGTEEREI
jgi:hypothetical protein